MRNAYAHRTLGRGLAGLATLVAGVVAGLCLPSASDAQEGPLSQVFPDEEITVRFRRNVPRRFVDVGTMRVRSDGDQAEGLVTLGRPLFDSVSQSRVVVRPEAITEYFQLVELLTPEDARRKASRVLSRLERTGKVKKLAAIDRAIRTYFGPSAGAGTRLDQTDVTATYPPQLLDPERDPFGAYRRFIAGDDALWEAHVGGDVNAFTELSSNNVYERFFHPVDPTIGVQSFDSLLRQREHRRVIVRRSRRFATFFPQLPTRRDASDAAYAVGQEYELSILRPLRAPKTVSFGVSGSGFRLAGTSLTFTVRNSEPQFAGVDERRGLTGVDRPRVVNVTPPNGEGLVDATTDWEDPDNAFLVPQPARRTFTVRVRFAGPLDPRTVDETTFTLTKTKTAPGAPSEQTVNEPVTVGVFLAQTRLGEVRVELTPAVNLDPDSEYQVVVENGVRGLNGEQIGPAFASTFRTN